MLINQLGKSGNFHDIAASFLVFFSLLVSVFSFGIVFLPRPALLAYESYHNFLAQASKLANQSSESDNSSHSNPKFSYRAPDRNLIAEIDKIWEQLNKQYLKDDH